MIVSDVSELGTNEKMPVADLEAVSYHSSAVLGKATKSVSQRVTTEPSRSIKVYRAVR
jgi:hypothetical protein